MTSLRLALNILCVYSTVITSYAARHRTGKIQDNKDIEMYFVVTTDATITTSGEIKVPVAEIRFQNTGKFCAVEQSMLKKITDGPARLKFPFTNSSSSTKYYPIRFNCILTATEVEASAKKPYYWDFTFKLIKGYLVDSQNSENYVEIFATDTLSVTKTVLEIGILDQESTLWHLKDQNMKTVRNVTIANASLIYLGSDDLTKTPFTFIDLACE